MKYKEKIINIIKYFLSIFIPVFFINFLVIALAWDGPTQSPPGGTLPFPLTPSATEQTKTGALGIGGIFEVTGTFLQLAGEKPVCNSTTRGVVWLEKGAAGTDSEVFFCKKDAADEYAWTTNNTKDENYYWNVPVGAVLKNYHGTETFVNNASTAGKYKLNEGMLVYENVGTYMLQIPENVTSVEVLVVAGGGGSGMGTTTTTINGGGGGAGGLIYEAVYAVEPGTPVTITVGDGGAGATGTGAAGSDGQNSVFDNLTATGGGGGGSSSSRPGRTGGSGGGGGRSGTNYGTAGAGTAEQGYNGAASSSSVASGGGGGAVGAASGTTRGPGFMFDKVYSTGGRGSLASGGSAGPANTGQGGDAPPTNSGSAGFAGGSGVVIVRWKHPIKYACGEMTEFTDSRDNQVYPVVAIGTQCWMAKNLNVGIRIDASTNQGTSCQNIHKYCYNNNESNCDTYGGHYQWDQAMCGTSTEGVQGICPDGWHLPTDAEWHSLENYLSTSTCDPNRTDWGCFSAGELLKTSQYAGSNFSGFGALLAGWVSSGSDGLDSYGIFWTSSPYGDDYSWHRFLGWMQPSTTRQYILRTEGASVRCIKD